MRIVARKALRAFWEQCPEAEQPLLAWYREVLAEDWAQPSDVKAKYRSCSILKAGRVVFNIKGNAFRLVAKVNYEYRVLYVRFVGTHEQYDEIDAEKV